MDNVYVVWIVCVVLVSAFMFGVITAFRSLSNPEQMDRVCQPLKVKLDLCESVCPNASNIERIQWDTKGSSSTTTSIFRFNDE